jgi:hypothetical protein
VQSHGTTYIYPPPRHGYDPCGAIGQGESISLLQWHPHGTHRGGWRDEVLDGVEDVVVTIGPGDQAIRPDILHGYA